MFPWAACKIQNHFLERSAIPWLNRSVPLSLYSFRAGSCKCRSSTDSKMGRDSDVAANANGNFKVEPKETHLRVKKLSSKAIIPSRGSAKAAGYDLSSARACIVPARGKALISTDLSIAVPADTYARIAPRSGLAWKHYIDVGAGVIDADYRGPVGVILFNHSNGDFEVKEGDRIAQLILEKIVTPEVVEVEDLDETVRGVDGFGSTGI